MAPMVGMRSGKGFRSVFHGLLLGGLLVSAVIIGLLAMHTLNLHGTAAADAPAAISLAVGHPADATHSTMHDSPGVAGDPDMSCAGCGTDDHGAMAMMCVLALLLVLLLVAPPRLLRGWLASVVRAPHSAESASRILPRAPSLHVLCISRT